MNSSIYVLLAVVLASLIVAFGILFYLYAKYRCYYYNYGHADEKIKKEIDEEYEFYNSKNPELSLKDFFELQRKRKKRNDIISSIFVGVVSFLLFVLVSFSLFTAVITNFGNQVFVGDKAYLIVETKSMSYKEKKNPYYNDLPDNQIPVNALIEIEKVAEDDIKLYDVIAFKYEDKIYVHRVVRMAVDDEGVKHFRTMGDTNNVSLDFETFTMDSVVGIYTGKFNIGVGRTISYVKSPIGIITLIMLFVLLGATTIITGKINKAYFKRIDYVADNMIEYDDVMLDETDSYDFDETEDEE